MDMEDSSSEFEVPKDVATNNPIPDAQEDEQHDV